VQNSLFVPQLGKIVNRRATYRLSDTVKEARTIDKLKAKLKSLRDRIKDQNEDESILGNCQYAVLPEGERLEGWSKEDKEELDDLVRHQLHSRRAKFKRAMKGFSQYVRRRKCHHPSCVNLADIIQLSVCL
jgi:ABC-type oligopeptide transport system ATPase subunit